MKPAPATAIWLLERLSSSAEDESLIGDLLEQYSVGRGRCWYWRQVLLIVFWKLYRASTQRARRSRRLFSARLFSDSFDSCRRVSRPASSPPR